MDLLFISLLLSTLSLSAGLYHLFAAALHLPSFASTRAALNLARHSGRTAKRLDTIIFLLSERVSKWIDLDDYRRRKLMSELRSVGISMAPETWIARAYVKAGLVLVIAIPVLPVAPVLAPVILFLAVRTLFRELKSTELQLKAKRTGIEADLPRFTATVAQELKSSRNVLAILEGYLDSAGPKFREELEITVSDMRSGSQETALTRLETRIGSTMLSDVVRGLLSVLRGDDGIQYFGLLSHDFKQMELQKLKLEAAKRPAKVRVYSGLLLACFMITYAVIIVMQIIQSANAFKM